MKKGLLVVSFGTSCAETRALTIEALERDLAAAYPDRKFFRAWTSGFIRKKLKASEGLSIDSVPEAMERILADGVTDLLVQPTHMMAGEEFASVIEDIRAFKERFSSVSLGEPLLASPEDISLLAKALEQIFSSVGENEMLALMGHGSSAVRENPYEKLNALFEKDGFERFRVGTVEFDPGFAPVLDAAKLRRPKKIYLAPLMVVAGDHALNDMAGDEEDSWSSMLRAEGFEPVSILKGMGEYEAVREMYISHASKAKLI
jgi:sirohydrochlorin cobaltochelatase